MKTILEGKLGRDSACDNAHEVELGYSYNGSGGAAFGGADKWPTVRASVSFQEGEEAKRDEFGKRLLALIEEFFAPKVDPNTTMTPEQYLSSLNIGTEEKGIPLKDLPKWMAGQNSQKK
jgi:hypothetical protein